MTTPQTPDPQHPSDPNRPSFLAPSEHPGWASIPPGQPAPTGRPAPSYLTGNQAATISRPKRRRRGTVIAFAAVGTLLVGAVGLGAATTSGTISAAGLGGSGQTETWSWGHPATGSGSGGVGSGSGGLGSGSGGLGSGSGGSGSGNGGFGSGGSSSNGGSSTVPNWGSNGSGSGQGSDPFGGSGGQSSGQTDQSSVDSDPATAAEAKGVALIDTQTTNGEAAGTGMVLTSGGEVLTNYHVVEGSTSVKVTIASSGRTYTASVVGADKSADVALLQLKGASGLGTVTIDNDTLKTGDSVTAVGNAGGTGDLTAADGTVTDLSTSITTASEYGVQGEKLTKLIETSSDVVAGDSGGPLIDKEGEVVGMDTAASTGGEVNGYAIAIDHALVIVAQIRSGDETSAVRIGPAAYLGVEIATTQTTERNGASVAGVVSGGAADRAGLSAGDTITRIGDTRIGGATKLQTVIGKHQPGDQVKITWTTSSGATKAATVTLQSSPIN